MRNLRILCLAVLFATFGSGCKSWDSLTVQAPGSPKVEVLGTPFSDTQSLSLCKWQLPNEGQCIDLKTRLATTKEEDAKDKLYAWKSNSFLVLIANEPIELPRRKMGFSKAGTDIIVPLGRETKARAWIIPPMPQGSEWTTDKDAPLARQIELRSLLCNWHLRKWRESLSHDAVAQTDAELAARLDELAVPLDGTFEINRTTEWTTTLELIASAEDKPVHLTFLSKHGKNFSPEYAAQTALLFPLLPILALSAASGNAP